MTEVLQKLWDVRVFLAAVVLFAVGFVTLLLHRNLMKKIIGLNIMDTAAYLLLTALGSCLRASSSPFPLRPYCSR